MSVLSRVRRLASFVAAVLRIKTQRFQHPHTLNATGPLWFHMHGRRSLVFGIVGLWSQLPVWGVGLGKSPTGIHFKNPTEIQAGFRVRGRRCSLPAQGRFIYPDGDVYDGGLLWLSVE